MKGSIRAKGRGSWQLCIDLGKDGAGKRQRKFEPFRGSKADAQKRLRQLLTILDRGIPSPARR